MESTYSNNECGAPKQTPAPENVDSNDAVVSNNNNAKNLLTLDLSPNTTITRTVTWKGVLFFGICTLMGSHFNNWSRGLECGFWPYFGVMWTICTAFGCVALCVAEMTAALPFSGGTYGVVRVTLGDLAGYLIGTTETFQYILYVAFNTVTMGEYITQMTGYDSKYEPLYWLITYAGIVFVLTFQKQLYWKAMWLLGTFICVMIILFCTMTRSGADFDKYASDPEITSVSDSERVYQFFRALPHGSWFFGLAAKIMPLACVETVNPTVNVPKAIYYSYGIAMVSAFCIIFSAASIRPGVSALRLSSAPLSYGFSAMFNIPFHQAIAFTLIAKFATCLCFSFAYSTQIVALAKSGFLWRTVDSKYFPAWMNDFVSILTGCAMGYVLMLVIWFWDRDFKRYLLNGYLLLGYSINVVIFATYISFRSKFRSLIKTYQSPFGIPGALYGSCVFITVFISIGALQEANDRWTSFVLLVLFMVVWTAPYYLYYQKHMTYSEEESTIMFIAYVIRANQARRARKLQGATTTPSSATLTAQRLKKSPKAQGNRSGGRSSASKSQRHPGKQDPLPTVTDGSLTQEEQGLELVEVDEQCDHGDLALTAKLRELTAVIPALSLALGDGVPRAYSLGSESRSDHDPARSSRSQNSEAGPVIRPAPGSSTVVSPSPVPPAATALSQQQCSQDLRVSSLYTTGAAVAGNSGSGRPRRRSHTGESLGVAASASGGAMGSVARFIPQLDEMLLSAMGQQGGTHSGAAYHAGAWAGGDTGSSGAAVYGERVAPLSARESEESRNRRAAAMDNVLKNELRYDDAVIGQLRTEIREFFDASSSSSEEGGCEEEREDELENV